MVIKLHTPEDSQNNGLLARLQRWISKKASYAFCDRWQVEGSLEETADAFVDTESLARWWHQFRNVAVIDQGESVGLHRWFRSTIKGFLPYTLQLDFVVVASQYPHGFEVHVGGDFEGRGCGRLRSIGDQVQVDLELEIEICRPLLRLFSLVFRPIMMVQHWWTMNRGKSGLNRELARRRMSQPDSGSLMPQACAA